MILLALMGRQSLPESFRELKGLISPMFPQESALAERMETTALGAEGWGRSEDTGAVWAASSSFSVILFFVILDSIHDRSIFLSQFVNI